MAVSQLIENMFLSFFTIYSSIVFFFFFCFTKKHALSKRVINFCVATLIFLDSRKHILNSFKVVINKNIFFFLQGVHLLSS